MSKLEPDQVLFCNISSHIFAHFGQMVSTPIGAPNSPEKCSQPTYTQFSTNIPNDKTINQSPPLVNQSHPYPVLYTTSQCNASVPINVTQSPVSLYSEYMGNPYNLQNNYNIYSSQSPLIVYQSQQPDTTPEKIPYNPSSDSNLNNEPMNEPAASQIARTEQAAYYENSQAANYFQSSNYFYTDPNASNIPPGSELLYGSDKNASNVLFFDSEIKTNDIPLLSPPISKS
ncbi:hypothetical protein CBL_09602 [Carabus blaptoides fortunei]